MKIVSSLALWVALSLAAVAEEPSSWLRLLNAQPGRSVPLQAGEVVFRPSSDPRFSGLVAVGFPESDGTLALGSLIWKGKAYAPLNAWSEILRELGFVEADDSTRQDLFVALLTESYRALGVHLYQGPPPRREGRPGPVLSQRQSQGQHRFQVWFWEEPAQRVGPEWRQVLYTISADAGVIKAKTLQNVHPDAENLTDFPSTP